MHVIRADGDTGENYKPLAPGANLLQHLNLKGEQVHLLHPNILRALSALSSKGFYYSFTKFCTGHGFLQFKLQVKLNQPVYKKSVPKDPIRCNWQDMDI